MGRRVRRTAILATIVLQCAATSVAVASPPAPDLNAALSALASERALSLLFDSALVKGLKAGAYRHDAPVDQALADMLRGTGLVAIRTMAGVYLIRKAPAVVERPPAPLAPPPAIADIFVVGRTTSNVDLPRSEDDIQPYQILSADRIDSAMLHTTGELLSEQVTINLSPPASLGSFHVLSFGSYVDISGLGYDQTSVTVDGRHLPGIPESQTFPPTDISALAPGAIDRVEALGLTAGAIFGVGATGGALNVVLKHDYRGFEVNVVNGVSARGDDARHRIDAKAGFESASGRTKGMVRIGYGQFGGDLLGSRAVGRQQLLLYQQLYPQSAMINGDAIFVQSLSAIPLQLTPAYGGAALGKTSTWLPLDAPALDAGGVDILRANAGKPVTSLSPDGQGALQSLAPATRTVSMVASLRQSIGERIELFADALFLRDTQHLAVPAGTSSSTLLFPGDGKDPFDQIVYVAYPSPGLVGRQIDHHDIDRETLGAIVRLGRGWSANADFSTGQAVWTTEVFAVDGGLDIDPFAGGASLAQQLRGLTIAKAYDEHGRDRMYDANVRLAGPLFALPGGQATLTATGEWRQDRNPGIVDDDFELGTKTTISQPSQKATVASGFVEARLPLLPSDGDFALWRGLELQLAARHDRYAIEIPGFSALAGPPPRIDNHDAVTSFTIGASVKPTAGLMLRASFADGYEPPAPENLLPDSIDLPLALVSDSKRGGNAVRDSGEFTLDAYGSPKLRPQRARSFSIGFVARPAIVPGLRISFDYDRLVVTHVQTDFANADNRYFLSHEADYPGRIIRAPLTTADQALGYTAGKIEEIDTSELDIGRTTVTVLESAVDYRRQWGRATVELYGRMTWEPRYTMRTDPDWGTINTSGMFNGPLKLRAIGGAGWSRGPWAANLNARYYGSYSTTYYDNSLPLAEALGKTSPVFATPSEHIPGKAYIDLALSYTSPVAVGARQLSVRYRLGVRNLFDVAPSPIASDAEASLVADPYGDLVGRRFELEVSVKF